MRNGNLFSAAKFGQHALEGNGSALFPLRDGLEKNALELRVRFEGFVPLGNEYGDVRTFGQVRVEFDVTSDYAS
jgi:hypothetical protein